MNDVTERSGVVPTIDKVVGTVSVGLAMVSGLAMMGVAVLTATHVVLRKTVGHGIPGAVELCTLALVIVVFFGLPYAHRAGGHVSMELVMAKLPEGPGRTLHLVGMTGCLVSVAWLALGSFERASASLARGEVLFGTVSVPAAPFRIAIVAGILVFGCELVLGLRRRPLGTVAR